MVSRHRRRHHPRVCRFDTVFTSCSIVSINLPGVYHTNDGLYQTPFFPIKHCFHSDHRQFKTNTRFDTVASSSCVDICVCRFHNVLL